MKGLIFDLNQYKRNRIHFPPDLLPLPEGELQQGWNSPVVDQRKSTVPGEGGLHSGDPSGGFQVGRSKNLG